MNNDTCRYSYVHWVDGVPATGSIGMTYLDPDNIILIPACSACQDFYKEQAK
jgi:hypothetical protein